MIILVLKYLRHHWIYALIIGYFGIAIGLHLSADIQILIPCVWKAISGYNCPGCGLTHAFIALLQLRWQEAWLENPLIYLIVPVLIALTLRDFIRFWRLESR